jgi:hypothetical protein
MKKLRKILWIAFIFSYLLLINDDFRNNVYTNWIIWLGIIIVSFIILVGMSIIRGKVSESFKKHFPIIMYEYGKTNAFIYSIILMISICFIGPIFIIYFLEKKNVVSFGKELSIYTSLTFSSMLITFYGKKFVELLNIFVVDNPSNKSIKLSEKVVSEDIIKTILFGIYFMILIISAIIKYKHIRIFEFDEKTVGVVILAFTTYIALDRTVSTYRKAKEIRLIEH